MKEAEVTVLRKARSRVIPLLLLANLAIAGDGRSRLAEVLVGDYWMGVYFGENHKVGFSHVSIQPDTFEGRQAYRVLSESRVWVRLMGVELELDTTAVEYARDDLGPLYLDFTMTSGGRTTRVVARFAERTVVCEVTSGAHTQERRIEIPVGVRLEVDPDLTTREPDLKPGYRKEFHYFNPATLAIERGALEVERLETIEWRGEKVETALVLLSTPVGSVTAWVSPEGEPLRMIGPLGLTLLAEPRQEAMAGVNREYSPSRDLAAAAALKVPPPWEDARKVRRLTVRLAGTAANEIPSDARQRTVAADENPQASGASALLTITAEPIPETGPPLPLSPPPEVSQHLESTPYVPSDDKEIRALAKAIVGSASDSGKAVRLLANWVHDNLRPRGDMGVIRSAKDVLQTRSGVCRDYAALYAALARAAGLPTKLVGGLCYWNDGFYYHAWAESYLDGWVSVDPTMGDALVDATHIKLVEGDLTALFRIGLLVGQLKVEIIEAQ